MNLAQITQHLSEAHLALRDIGSQVLTPAKAAQRWKDMATAVAEAQFVLRLIDDLRNGEGSAITIPDDNPDFGPTNIVTCNGDWTDWKEITFSGETLIEALRAAAEARAEQEKAEALNP